MEDDNEVIKLRKDLRSYKIASWSLVGIVIVLIVVVVLLVLRLALPVTFQKEGTGEILKAYTHGPYIALVGHSLDVTGSASGGCPPYKYAWDWYGGCSQNVNPAHFSTYQNWGFAGGELGFSGTYNLTLFVLDSCGQMAWNTTEVYVKVVNE